MKTLTGAIRGPGAPALTACGALILLALPAPGVSHASWPLPIPPSPVFDMPSPASDSIRLDLALPDRIGHGDSVTVVVRAENVSDHTVELYLRGREIAFDIVVSDPEGTVIWRRLGDDIIPGILRLEILEPGGTLEVRATWDQRGSAGALVPPGDYRVHGELLTEGEPLVTPVRSFEIVPADGTGGTVP